MGIRGLTTYIAQNNDLSFDPYRLQNCRLVVDGNSVASQLYVREFGRSKSGHCAFGGDYDEYARTVKRFFCQLACCSVKVIVVFDGGKEPRKLATSWARLKGRILATGKITPANSTECPLPLLMLEVFRWVATHSGASVAQCDFEADEEIAALARALSCPLLSFDSDFYIHAVPCYIPFPTLSTELTEEIYEPSQGNSSGRHIERYIECSAFSVTKFLNRIDIGDWKKKSRGAQKILQVEVLPLVAALLGNDYVKPQTFRHFFSQIQLPKSNSRSYQQRRIVGLLEWLRLENSLDSAIIKILNHTKKGQREKLENLIRQTVDVYVGCPSQLLRQLKLSSTCESKTNSIATAENSEVSGVLVTDAKEGEKTVTEFGFVNETLDLGNESFCPVAAENVEDYDHLSIEEDEFSCSSGSKSVAEYSDYDEDDINVDWNERKKQLPSWFLERFRQCELPPSFMDIMMQRTYLCPPQVEDQSQPHSHAISFPILRAILRLLTPVNDSPLVCMTRVNRHAASLTLDPLPQQPSWPSPENLLHVPSCDRLQVLLQALNLVGDSEEENRERKLALGSLPSDWRLLGLCLAFWRRFSPQQKVDEKYLIVACFCIVVLRVIDVRAGPPGKKSKKVRMEKIKRSSKQNVQSESSSLKENNRKCSSDGIKINVSDGKPDETKNVEENEIVSEIDEKTSKANSQKCPGVPPTVEKCKEELKVLRKSVKELLQVVSADDCFKVSGSDGQLFQMRQIHGGSEYHSFSDSRHLHPKRPRSFIVSTVHAFAELQSVIFHIGQLNSLLGKPLLPCTPYTSFTGTLAYNAHYRTHGKPLGNSKKAVWQGLLGTSAPSLENLMDEFYKSVTRLAWGTDIVEESILLKRHPKKKKRNKKTVNENVQEGYNKKCESSGMSEYILLDPENKFSALNLID